MTVSLLTFGTSRELTLMAYASEERQSRTNESKTVYSEGRFPDLVDEDVDIIDFMVKEEDKKVIILEDDEYLEEDQEGTYKEDDDTNKKDKKDSKKSKKEKVKNEYSDEDQEGTYKEDNVDITDEDEAIEEDQEGIYKSDESEVNKETDKKEDKVKEEVTEVTSDECVDTVDEQPASVEEDVAADASTVPAESSTGDALVNGAVVDENYIAKSVSLSDEDRKLLGYIVQTETSGQGFTGAAIVAQAIRDVMVYDGYSDVNSVLHGMSYAVNYNKKPDKDTIAAINYIFDQGGTAVQHKVKYFYAPAKCTSKFHESQTFVTEYGGHRFFSDTQ